MILRSARGDTRVDIFYIYYYVPSTLNRLNVSFLVCLTLLRLLSSYVPSSSVNSGIIQSLNDASPYGPSLTVGRGLMLCYMDRVSEDGLARMALRVLGPLGVIQDSGCSCCECKSVPD